MPISLLIYLIAAGLIITSVPVVHGYLKKINYTGNISDFCFLLMMSSFLWPLVVLGFLVHKLIINPLELFGAKLAERKLAVILNKKISQQSEREVEELLMDKNNR